MGLSDGRLDTVPYGILHQLERRGYVISVTLSPKIRKISKIGKFRYSGIKKIISQMEKLELSVQFRRARNSQFLDIFLKFSGLKTSVSISHSPSPLASG